MELINSYIRYLQYERRYSPHTAEAYRHDLSEFCNFLHTNDGCSLQDVDFKWIRRWVVALSKAGNSSRTVNRKIVTLRSFFRYLRKEGVVTDNPADKISVLKTDKQLPVFLTAAKMDEVLDEMPEGETFSEARDKLIPEMFYMTGIRLSELIQLKESDVDIRGMTIKVLGKRNKERIIPLLHEFCKSLHRYISLKRTTFPDTDALFVLDSGKPLYARWVQRLTGKSLGAVTTVKKRSPHVLRHSFATNMLDNGADLNAIKELLGHAGLAATQIYTHNSLKRIKKVYQQAHPRA
ncbi:MAG: tyrosine-type recombinase/integrase [Bacteroidales bacterium]|jgi:integrase/recombinase XerC|nr:tyrosine-type recombinase/integrase [Bacteroidales bacterium]